MKKSDIRIIQFFNKSRNDKKLLKRFVKFHRELYRNNPHYVPLLDYEYLGFKLLGITGFFEPDNLFYKHAEITFFLAVDRDDQMLGRCCAFVNHRHNSHWGDGVGFFGHFESIDDPAVAEALINSSQEWLKEKGMDTIRGPQNLPVNEATPGLMTDGFDTRPIVYYHYNEPYYENLLIKCGLNPVKRVFSWEVPVMTPMEEKLERVANLVMKRKKVTVESWGQRSLDTRKEEMLSIYNDAWENNFGFVPFLKEEFDKIIDDMLLVMDKNLFVFVYVDGEPAGFFGGVPNIFECMQIGSFISKIELLRALKVILGAKRVKGFRFGYLGVKKKFRHMALDGVLIWYQKKYSQARGYRYCDIGWVLDDNDIVINTVKMMKDVKLSKTYTIFEKPISN
ncbi:MAG: hypothetical protein DRP87_08780 [Spirochaetes bacterium]|nr:MAG: hypothetical protein DRP87_08780 [Spirochaetota bacterium]